MWKDSKFTLWSETFYDFTSHSSTSCQGWNEGTSHFTSLLYGWYKMMCIPSRWKQTWCMFCIQVFTCCLCCVPNMFFFFNGALMKCFTRPAALPNRPRLIREVCTSSENSAWLMDENMNCIKKHAVLTRKKIQYDKRFWLYFWAAKRGVCRSVGAVVL